MRSPDQGLLPTVAWQYDGGTPEYALDGGVYCAGSAIEWARALGLFADHASLNRFDRPAAVDRDLLFVPALSGLACPHWDRRAAGLWIGLSLDTDPRDMMQSLLEGIALRTAEVIRAMSSLTGIGDEVSVDGGVSVNPVLLPVPRRRPRKVRGGQDLPGESPPSAPPSSPAPARSAAGTAQPRVQRYLPETNRQCRESRAARFSEAVSRSAQWRKPPSGD